MTFPSYFATNASYFCLSPETSVLEHSSDVRKGWDKVVEDSWGTCPHRKWAQSIRAWLNSWDFGGHWALQKPPHRMSHFHAVGRKSSLKQQRDRMSLQSSSRCCLRHGELYTPTLLLPPTVISSRLLCSALTANLALALTARVTAHGRVLAGLRCPIP